jgi:hypothetical protein
MFRKRSTAYGVALTILLATAFMGPACSDTHSVVLTASGRTITINSSATWSDTLQLWVYEYSMVTTSSWARPFTHFILGNEKRYAWIDAWTNYEGPETPKIGPSPVYNPNDPGQNSIIWADSVGLPYVSGRLIKFGYKLVHNPGIVKVTAGWGGGTGQAMTLGMVPEPAGIAGLLLGTTGLGGCWLGRLRRRQ